MVEWSVPTLEIHISNQVIGKFCFLPTALNNCIEKTKIKKKEAENGPFFEEKNDIITLFLE